MLSGTGGNQVTEDILTYKYNCCTGPLWCVKLIPDKHSQLTSESSVELQEELQSDFPYCYIIHFGFHHILGVADTLTRTMGTLISLIEDLLSGTYINDKVKVEEFSFKEDFAKLAEKHPTQLEDNHQQNDIRLDLDSDEQESPTVAAIMRVPDGTEGKSAFLTETLDSISTSQFLSKCKQEGVTFNSCLISLANMALVDILVDRGIIQEAYKFTTLITVDGRRYWKAGVSKYHSSSLGRLPFFTEIPLKLSKTKYWHFVRLVNKKLYTLLKSSNVTTEVAHEKSSGVQQCDIVYNNIGDLTSRLAKGRENIRVTFLSVKSSFHNTGETWQIIVHTLKGCLSLNLRYNTRFVSKKLAQDYLGSILMHLHLFALHTNPEVFISKL